MNPEFEQHFITVGQNLQKLREDKNFTREELAERSGVSMRMIEKIENGQADFKISVIIDIAIAMDIEVNRIIRDPNF